MQLYFMHINSLINVSLISISIILRHMANGALYSHPRDTKVPTTLLPIRTMLNVRNCYPRSRTPHPRLEEEETNPRCPNPTYEDRRTQGESYHKEAATRKSSNNTSFQISINFPISLTCTDKAKPV